MLINNLYICHRPYHVLRSVDLIHKKYIGHNNVLIVFDVISYNTKEYKIPEGIEILFPYFSRVIIISRENEVRRVYDIINFYKYYHNIVNKNKNLLQEFKDYDNLFFFSDEERPVEILVSLFAEQKKKEAKVILVDEGIASYYKTGSVLKDIVFGTIIKGLHYSYLNPRSSYGSFNKYTNSLASFPNKAVFHGIIEELTPLDDQLCAELRNKYNIFINTPCFIYIDNVIQNQNVTIETEVKILKKIENILKKRNIEFYIKPHPTQCDDKFDNKFRKDIILNKAVPSELLFQPGVIVGSAGSSTLLNAFLLNCSAMNIAGLFNLHSVFNNLDWINIPSIDDLNSFIGFIDNYFEKR